MVGSWENIPNSMLGRDKEGVERRTRKKNSFCGKKHISQGLKEVAVDPKSPAQFTRLQRARDTPYPPSHQPELQGV